MHQNIMKINRTGPFAVLIAWFLTILNVGGTIQMLEWSRKSGNRQ
jgi:hypothetical protein